MCGALIVMKSRRYASSGCPCLILCAGGLRYTWCVVLAGRVSLGREL